MVQKLGVRTCRLMRACQAQDREFPTSSSQNLLPVSSRALQLLKGLGVDTSILAGDIYETHQTYLKHHFKIKGFFFSSLLCTFPFEISPQLPANQLHPALDLASPCLRH